MDTIPLPIGPCPGWELESHSDTEASDEEPQELRNIPESLVVSQSLRQSRTIWLSSAFPKFSAKARGGKPPEVVPPPHSIKVYGRYDVRIGPHIFSDTTFYEVCYLPEGPAGTGTPTGQAPSHYTFRTYDPSQADTQLSTALSALTESSDTHKDSPDTSVTVTPDLVSQVSAAASTNPDLKNLLHLATTGKATPKQQNELGHMIRSLGAAQLPVPTFGQPTSSGISGNPGAEASYPIDPPRRVREFDIVIEFKEKPSDRWIVPRGPAVCERLDVHSLSDVKLSTTIQSTSSADTSESLDTSAASHVVAILISKVPPPLWELLLRWVGGEEGITRSRAVLRDIAAKAPPRAYLPHRLPAGPLLEQLTNNAPPRYNTKPVMPSNADSTRTRRKSSHKQRDAHKGSAQLAQTISTSTPHSKPKSKFKVVEPSTPIACKSCGRPDVPLLNFGRYCKSCITAGRAGDATTIPPQAYATSTLPHHPWSYAGSSPYNTVASSVATSGAPTASAAKDPTGPKTTTEIVPVVIRAENATPQAGPSTNTDHDVEMHT